MQEVLVLDRDEECDPGIVVAGEFWAVPELARRLDELEVISDEAEWLNELEMLEEAAD